MVFKPLWEDAARATSLVILVSQQLTLGTRVVVPLDGWFTFTLEY